MSKTTTAGGGGGTPPVNTVAPVISGSGIISYPLSCADGTWTGTPVITYTYQWKRNGIDIVGETNSTYILDNADYGNAITCEVTGTNAFGFSSAVSNTITGTAIAPVNTVAPVIAGTNVVGSTLTTTKGTWTVDPTPLYTYQWYRGASPISGATSDNYTLVQADAAQSITCIVTATNVAGTASATSNALTIIDADAQAFLTAAVITNATQVNAVNQLTVDLKNASIWTKMKAVYPFVGGTATTHKFNLKNPLDTDAAYRLVFNGGWTHSSTGALPNGTNGYADTKFNISTGFTSANKGSVGGYWRTALPNANYYFGVNDPVGGNNSRFWMRNVGVPNKDHYAGGTTLLRDTTATDYSGFSAMCRRSTTDMFAIKRDGTYITLATSVTIGFSNTTLPFAANNSSGVYSSFSNAEIALGYISDDLTQSEMTNLRTSVITFQTTLGRQV
jgi:hypothetical protein